jgi:Ca2+/H+ antiporter
MMRLPGVERLVRVFCWGAQPFMLFLPVCALAVLGTYAYLSFFFFLFSTELLVDVVDDILKDSGIQEKFLGITLFALVPNTTEFMNAISFALNGNIALR